MPLGPQNPKIWPTWHGLAYGGQVLHFRSLVISFKQLRKGNHYDRIPTLFSFLIKFRKFLFKKKNDSSLFSRGVGAMELVAMDMKLRGMYIARQLSFKGVTFRIEEIALDKSFVKVYNDSVKMVCFEIPDISFVWNIDKGLQACLYVSCRTYLSTTPHLNYKKFYKLQIIWNSLISFHYLCITILWHSQMIWLF